MATTKLTVQEVLISLEEAKTEAALFRATDKKLYVSYSTVSSGDKLDYSYPPTELQDVYPVASAPNITGGVYYEVVSTLVDPDDNEGEWVAIAAYEPKTRTVHLSEITGFEAQTYGDPETGENISYYEPILKIFKYSGIQLLAAESKYATDFNGDEIIGDAINASYGAGIYSTASGGLYWSPQEETEGSAPSADAKLISSDAKFISSLAAAYELLTLAGGSLVSRPIALDNDKEENDAQVAFPVYKAVKNSDPIFASLNLYDINSETGKYKVTAVTKPIDILKYESLFESDFNRDEAIGDAITGEFGAGICKTASGSLYWSPASESLGSAPSSEAKLLSSDPKFVSTFTKNYDLLTIAGGALASRPIALDKDKIENDSQVAQPVFRAIKNAEPVFSSLNLYDINSATGKYKLTSYSRAADIYKYENLFEFDFNNDGTTGNPLA